jgi:hypothetical protein
MTEQEELNLLAKKIPNHLVIEKCLWVGNLHQDIDHINNDLDNPLDYLSAFRKMVEKI